jgi:hypothetical protein
MQHGRVAPHGPDTTRFIPATSSPSVVYLQGAWWCFHPSEGLARWCRSWSRLHSGYAVGSRASAFEADAGEARGSLVGNLGFYIDLLRPTCGRRLPSASFIFLVPEDHTGSRGIQSTRDHEHRVPRCCREAGRG